MKIELLALTTAALAAAQATFDAVSALPDDPTATPTGLRIVYANISDGTCSTGIAWDVTPDGAGYVLDYRGAEGNANGPQEWTGITAPGMAGSLGELALLSLVQPEGSEVLLRLRSTAHGKAESEALILPFTVPPIG